MTELSHARTPAASHDVDQDATTSCGIQAFMALSGETRTPTGPPVSMTWAPVARIRIDIPSTARHSAARDA